MQNPILATALAATLALAPVAPAAAGPAPAPDPLSGGAPASEIGRDFVGERVGFSIVDRGRRDRIGFTGVGSPYPDDAAELRKCTATAPTFAIRTGNWSVADRR